MVVRTDGARTISNPDPIDWLDFLTEAYYEASNALTSYGRSLGFVPGARVRGEHRDGVVMTGVIADYGPLWTGRSSCSVPVLRDRDGVVQPWAMRSLTITEPSPTELE